MTPRWFLVQLRSGRVAVGFAALLLGVMIAMQFRLQRIVPPPTATDQLLALLKSSDQKRAQLTAEVAHLNALLNQKLTQAAAAQRLSQQLVQAEMLAGTIPVQGPGITVIWSNGQAPSAYQLTDIDLLLLVNELRAAGAQAIKPYLNRGFSFIALFAAEGKEEFYKHRGFSIHPRGMKIHEPL